MISRRSFIVGGACVAGVVSSSMVERASAEVGALRFAYFDEFAPLSFRDDTGDMAGLLVEAVDLVAREAGTTVQHLGLPWARAQRDVANGEADALCTNPTPSRRDYMLFCETPLVVNRQVALHRRGDQRFQGFRQRSDMSGITLIDYLGNGIIEEQLGGIADITWVTDQVSAHQMVAIGRGDAFIVSEIEARHVVDAEGLQDSLDYTVLEFMSSDRYTIGIRKSLAGVENVVASLETSIQSNVANGLLPELISEYT